MVGGGVVIWDSSRGEEQVVLFKRRCGDYVFS